MTVPVKVLEKDPYETIHTDLLNTLTPQGSQQLFKTRVNNRKWATS